MVEGPSAFVVYLDRVHSPEDARQVATAIMMIKGVLSVKAPVPEALSSPDKTFSWEEQLAKIVAMPSEKGHLSSPPTRSLP